MIVGFEVRGGEGVFEGNERIGGGLMRNFGSVRQVRLRRGFTLLELAIVMVLVAIVFAILLLVLQRAQAQVWKMHCRNNLKNLGLGLHNYHDVFGQLPLNGFVSAQLAGMNEVKVENAQSFLPPLINYTDSGDFINRYQWRKPTFDPANAKVIKIPVSNFNCPFVPDSRGEVNTFLLPKGTIVYSPFRTAEEYATTYGATDYIVHSGVTEGFRKTVYQEGTIPKNGLGAVGPIRIYVDAALAKALGSIPANENVSKDDVKDGISNTILISESAGRNELWRKGRKISEKQDPEAYARQKMMGGGGWADPFNQAWMNGRQADGTGTNGPCAINCSNEPDAGLYSFHAGGAHAALVDGSVRFLNEKLSPMILGRLVMRADGEKIDGEF